MKNIFDDPNIDARMVRYLGYLVGFTLAIICIALIILVVMAMVEVST